MEELSSESSLSDSWVALTVDDSDVTSLSSSCFSGIEHAIVKSRLKGSIIVSTSSSSCNSSIHSPPRLKSAESSLKETPCISGINSPINQFLSLPLEEALPRLMQDKKNTDWVWDWSSQPTNTPPKEVQLRHPKRKSMSLSLRNTDALDKFFSWKFLQILIPSLIISNLLSFGIGYLLGHRVASSPKSS